MSITEKEYLRIAADEVSRLAAKGPVAVDPDVAEYMGAFEEDALSYEDALDSFFDGETPADQDEAPERNQAPTGHEEATDQKEAPHDE